MEYYAFFLFGQTYPLSNSLGHTAGSCKEYSVVFGCVTWGRSVGFLKIVTSGRRLQNRLVFFIASNMFLAQQDYFLRLTRKIKQTDPWTFSHITPKLYFIFVCTPKIINLSEFTYLPPKILRIHFLFKDKTNFKKNCLFNYRNIYITPCSKFEGS